MNCQPKPLLAICLTASLLGGCNFELPLVGNVQEQVLEALETIENVAPPLEGVIRPIKRRFFPRKTQQKGPSNTARPHTRSTKQDENKESPVVKTTPTPIPIHKGFTPQQQTKQNMAFDHWRSLGIQRIYEGQTQEAIACFKKALAIRPNDTYIQDWIFAAENPIQSSQGGGGLPKSQPQVPPALPNIPQ